MDKLKGIIQNPDIILEYVTGINLSNSLVYLAGSLMEGFGNQTSDVDVYVICDVIPFIENGDDIIQSFLKTDQHLIRNVIHDGIRFDFEYWTWDDFNRASKGLNSLNFKTDGYIERLSNDEFDLLHRLKFGKPIANTIKFQEVYNSIEFEDLGYYLIAIQSEKYQGYLEDLQGAYLSKDYGSAFFLSRHFLDEMMISYLAAHGETNPSLKWLYRKALRYQERTQDTELLTNYLKFHSQPFDLDTINDFIRDIINFAQSLNTKAQAALKVKQVHNIEI